MRLSILVDDAWVPDAVRELMPTVPFGPSSRSMPSTSGRPSTSATSIMRSIAWPGSSRSMSTTSGSRPSRPGRSYPTSPSRPGAAGAHRRPRRPRDHRPALPNAGHAMSPALDLYELLPCGLPPRGCRSRLPTGSAARHRLRAGRPHSARHHRSLGRLLHRDRRRSGSSPTSPSWSAARPLHRVAGSWRADVANTIYYRRRKGTLAMLEELAGGRHRLGRAGRAVLREARWAQHLDHLRTRNRQPRRVGSIGSARSISATSTLWTGSAARSTTSSARSTSGLSRPGRGRHNIKKIGFFLWRLRSNPLIGRRTGPRDRPPPRLSPQPPRQRRPDLHQRRRQRGARPTEIDLPVPIRRLALLHDVEAAAAAGQAAAAESAANGANCRRAGCSGGGSRRGLALLRPGHRAQPRRRRRQVGRHTGRPGDPSVPGDRLQSLDLAAAAGRQGRGDRPTPRPDDARPVRRARRR